MLRIRSEQFEALSAASQRDFVDKAVAAVTRHWPDVVAREGEAATRLRVAAAAAQAERHGFTTQQQALRFINVIYALGDDFAERHAWAKRILDNGALTPDARLALLAEKTQAWLEGEQVE